MLQERADDHTATLLLDGTVLVAGTLPVTAELYDPSTGNWTATAGTIEVRGVHTATRLRDGTVLVAGGSLDGLTSAELYDPIGRSWAATGSMRDGRWGHTAKLLGDGTVLVVGGASGSGDALASAELYDPATGTWTVTGQMAQARVAFTATQLPDGKVLVVGGGVSEGSGFFDSAELYDPTTGVWTTTGRMVEARRFHAAANLPDGRVLVAGGVNGSVGHLTSSEIYDPVTESWTAGARMAEPRGLAAATALADGRVLVAGGSGDDLASAEVYDPTTGSWTLTGSMVEWRAAPSATLLQDGRVLVAGGFTVNGSSESAELYDPDGTAPTGTPAPPWLSRCEPGCQGPIAPGTFISAGFVPGLRMTFSDDTWFNTADYPDEIQFERSIGVLRFWRNPGASSKTEDLLRDVPRTPQGLTSWIVSNSDMEVSNPETVTIGDGISATTFTLQISDTNVNVDPGCPVRSCLSFLWVNNGHVFAIGYGEAVRLYLFTVGSGSDAQTIVISLDEGDAGRLALMTTVAAPILETIRFP